MSIEVRDTQETGLSSFSSGDMNFDLSFAQSKPLVVSESKPMEKVKKKQIKKKEKPKPNYYFRLLRESWQKKIFNRAHSTNPSRTHEGVENEYNCPILCVAEYLGLIKKRFKGSHYDLSDQLHHKKEVITYEGEIKCGMCKSMFGQPAEFNNEPLYSQHLAYDHNLNNSQVADVLEQSLWNRKPVPMIPQKDKDLELHWHVPMTGVATHGTLTNKTDRTEITAMDGGRLRIRKFDVMDRLIEEVVTNDHR